MKRIAAVEAPCATEPISRRAISERGAAPWRTEANRMMKSCTAPPSAAPRRIQIAPGRYPNCARKDRADQRARRADRGEVVAEENEAVGAYEIAAVRSGDRGGRAARVQARDAVARKAP